MQKSQKATQEKESLDRFIEKSAAVGSENILITRDELQSRLRELTFEYIYLPSFDLVKDVKASEEGINQAVVEVDYAISETGSVVIDSKDENKRLATCLADKLYVMVPMSRLVTQLHDVADFLEERTMGQGGYVAFITGASRTADIERVLTVGVHGPKEMVVFIVTDL